MLLLPRINANPNVAWAVVGAGGVLVVWGFTYWRCTRSRPDAFRTEFVSIKSHWVQACVQFSVMLWWGLYWNEVYRELPLILAQVLFLYTFEALISWSRGWTWRMGFGPLPIVFSTNLLLWFQDDWYALQFAMVALGVLGKQFLTWKIPGRTGHIFNPSAFGQTAFAIVLIWTATTKELTLGPQIAATFETPYMLVVIFLGGLVVQYFFQVTLMTFSAVATLCVINLIYTWQTGVYYFVDVSIAAPVFLGMHLLMTDPSTTPRSNIGRVMVGSLYALGYSFLFRALDIWGVPIFWDKLLPVPVLNLCVPLIDRVCHSGLVGRVNAAWENLLPPRKLNLVHMGLWAAFFATMMFTGFAYGPHPGDSIPFWQQAVKDGKPFAERSLAMATASQALSRHDGAAFNELGLLSLSGKGVPQSRNAAAQSFAQACELGDLNGCENVVIQYLYLGEGRSQDDLKRALDCLEAACNTGQHEKSCYLLAAAYELGRGRPVDPARAIALLQRCDPGNGYVCKAIARIALGPDAPPIDLHSVAIVLSLFSQRGDAEASWYVAHMHFSGNGLPVNPALGRSYMERACEQGATEACDAMKGSVVPAYKRPVMTVPGWSTGFPSP